MKLIRRLIIFIMIFIFLIGLGVLLYPFVKGYIVDNRIQHDAEEFLSWVELAPFVPDSSGSHVIEVEPAGPAIPEPTEPNEYVDLWYAMMNYNRDIYLKGQQDLDCEYAYEKPSFKLKDYGLESEIYAVITIPSMELEMPIYLGATYQHMADGAALLSQTSIPMGGTNTNAVIAGHRGWGGASYFRYIDQLQPGDEVIITNLWEELHYEVSEIQIIQPNEVEKILIQPGRELITLLTCHPYASGGRQRYLVICERIPYEPDTQIDHQ